jgi:hypothetical protein
MPYQRHIFQQFMRNRIEDGRLLWIEMHTCKWNSYLKVLYHPPTSPFKKRQRKRKGGLRFRETAVCLHTAFWGQFKAVRASAWQLQSKAARASAWQLRLNFDLF